MFRRIKDWLGYIQTWIWIWGITSTLAASGVAIWALISRVPGVVVFVLALSTAVLAIICLETFVIVYVKINQLLGARYRRAITALSYLRTTGVVLRNRAVTSSEEVQTFAKDADAFEAAALAAMEGAATLIDIAWFRDLHEWIAPPTEGYNDDHKQRKAILDEKLRRMLEIAQRIEAKIR